MTHLPNPAAKRPMDIKGIKSMSYFNLNVYNMIHVGGAKAGIMLAMKTTKKSSK